MLSIKQAAEYMGLSTKTLYRFVLERRLGHYKIGSRILIRQEDVEEFLGQCRIEKVDELINENH